MNRLLLSGRVQERSALRYTPAGLPALDVVLAHTSEVQQAGATRKISLEVKAVAIGEATQPLLQLPLGQDAVFAGFLASGRNGRGWVFHVTELEAAPPDAAAPT